MAYRKKSRSIGTRGVTCVRADDSATEPWGGKVAGASGRVHGSTGPTPGSSKRRTPLLRRLSVIAAALALGGTAVAAYCFGVVYQARRYTVSTVLPNTRAAGYALTLSDLTPRQLNILLKVEDPSFFQHHGVDLSTPGAGITTITQGLVKQLYFERFKPGAAKLKQTLIAAYALDPLMPKEEQLRLFVNTVYLGPDVRGFAQAASVFFQKPFEALGEDEYMAIVAMIIAPDTFDVRRFPSRNAERVRRIKLVVEGRYTPRGLFDLYYGKLDAQTRKNLPAMSYFESYYR